MARPERIIRALARLAPAWRRDEWRAEWMAEVAHYRKRYRRLGRFPVTARARLTLRSSGALFHVLDLWRHEWSLDMLWNDTSFALRRFAKRPAIAATIIATLAVTIGLTTAIFSLVDGILLKPLPYPAADRLVAVWPDSAVSPAYMRELEPHANLHLSAVAAYSGWGFNISAGEATEKIDGARVTTRFFDVFRIEPLAGRTFRADDEAGGVPRIIISERYQRRYPQRARVGALLTVNGRPAEIVGVMPASFRFPGVEPEVWMLLPVGPPDPNFQANLASVIARLHDGDTPQQASERLRPLAEARAAGSSTPEAIRAAAIVRPLRDVLVGDVTPLLRMLLAAVLILLVVGLLNVANLLLADGTTRVQELSIRGALGAGRPRLLRQLVAESGTLVIIGGVLGVAAAFQLIELLREILPPDTPRLHEIGLNGRVLAFSACMGGATAVTFGILSAFHAGRVLPADGLRSAARGTAATGDRRTRRTRTFFVASEIALAMLLVSSGALLARSYGNVVTTDPGFDYEPVLTVPASLPPARFRGADAVRAGLKSVEERIANIPGVAAVGAIQLLPLTSSNWNPEVVVDGRASLPEEIATINWRTVSTGYFDAMRIPVRRGRALSPDDGPSALPVALVNERFAATIFPGEDPIGRRIRTGFESREQWVTIVGIVGDVRQHAMAEPPRPEMYRPLAQHPVATTVWMVRGSVPPATLMPSVRSALRDVDPDIAVGRVQPLAAVVYEATAAHRAATVLLLSLAAGTFALALIGVLGLGAYEAAQRRGEIAVRLALGASRASVLAMIIGRSGAIGIAGIAAGLIAAIAAGDLLRTLLVGIQPGDVPTLAAAAAVLFAAVLISSYVPARRAAGQSPVDILRLQ